MVITECRKYDHLFDNLIDNAVGGIKIFSKDMPYRISQRYDAVSDEERGIWQRLSAHLEAPIDRYASREYVVGARELGISSGTYPHFESMSARIHAASGWRLAPVAGFLDEYVFFTLNAAREFPVTDIIRKSHRFNEKYAGVTIQNEEGYTPEPDIFHDVFGHVPFLMDRAYGDFLQTIGDVGLEILRDERGLGSELVAHNLKRLQNFAWWTYEFGIMKKQPGTDAIRRVPNDMQHEIYGAGILSSYDEVMHVVACSQGRSQASRLLPFDIEQIALTRFDYSTIQDRYFVIDSMESLYQAFDANRQIFFFEG